ncbi:NADH dehydrogenase [ubiquinone] 1 beta subcomplex subunit 8, mitochondrial [Orussus abietinus]|uniref:NADH dehydrogenase [ubiquinone] 1 beta subcomplex subunit 8, mitochondrial n=1 Tax=Orussus abietinus TaxID=222816 RepID=UPI00062540C0|nr:NADH dehydrogenase [ubiquinone] 1 beta subcomplex subunit 8, mitochondrial [Orussus abietinus]
MAALTKLGRVLCALSVKNNIYSYNIARHVHYRDWQPGPCPQTEEERIKAAKKYNLVPEDYRIPKDKDNVYGDYPDLPFIGQALKDPYYPWDSPEYRRNFNETVNMDFDICDDRKLDPGKRTRFSILYMFSTTFCVFGSIYLLYLLGMKYPSVIPVTEKQIPKPGVTHYTFEPLE